MVAYELKLTGKHASEHGVALIDECDVEAVLQHRWSVYKIRSREGKYYFYAGAKIDGKNTLLHRFILKAQKGQLVDHQDQNTLNCQRYNIRICTHSQNMMNRKVLPHNKLGVKGVWRDAKTGLFKAVIRCNGKRTDLGRFKSVELAKSAYDEAAIRLHGEFARLA